jgi:hypothetical protein
VGLEGTKIRPWNLAETGKRIRKNSMASSLSLMLLKFSEGTEYALYHTPVTDDLIAAVSKDLNPLLHAQTRHRASADPWWHRTRARLVETYRAAWLACQGDSMTPPLGNIKTGEMHPARIEVRPQNQHVVDLMQRSVGQRFEVHVSYPDHPPPEWSCDL